MNQSNLIGGACAYQPTVNTLELAMTSLEIADLVGSRHDKVKQSIERLAKRGAIALPSMVKIENKQSNSPNRFTNVYYFEGDQGKRDSIIVVTRLCKEFTPKLPPYQGSKITFLEAISQEVAV